MTNIQKRIFWFFTYRVVCGIFIVWMGLSLLPFVNSDIYNLIKSGDSKLLSTLSSKRLISMNNLLLYSPVISLLFYSIIDFIISRYYLGIKYYYSIIIFLILLLAMRFYVGNNFLSWVYKFNKMWLIYPEFVYIFHVIIFLVFSILLYRKANKFLITYNEEGNNN